MCSSCFLYWAISSIKLTTRVLWVFWKATNLTLQCGQCHEATRGRMIVQRWCQEHVYLRYLAFLAYIDLPLGCLSGRYWERRRGRAWLWWRCWHDPRYTRRVGRPPIAGGGAHCACTVLNVRDGRDRAAEGSFCPAGWGGRALANLTLLPLKPTWRLVIATVEWEWSTHQRPPRKRIRRAVICQDGKTTDHRSMPSHLFQLSMLCWRRRWGCVLERVCCWTELFIWEKWGWSWRRQGWWWTETKVWIPARLMPWSLYPSPFPSMRKGSSNRLFALKAPFACPLLLDPSFAARLRENKWP